MANKDILKMVEDSYKGFTKDERESIARQVSGRVPRNAEEQELYDRYRHQNHESDSG